MNEKEILTRYQIMLTHARDIKDKAIQAENERHETKLLRIHVAYDQAYNKAQYWLNTTEAS